MRVFSIATEAILETDQLPQAIAPGSFVWVSLARLPERDPRGSVFFWHDHV
jgi:hypothetical protein